MSRKLISSLKSLPYSKLRSDIVNPTLCDDVIQHLKPSLAQYVGCTIIDINPGACLFSQKLHDHLKPRSHVLLEPRAAHYERFLKPLLESPGSRYHLRDWPDEHCWETTHFIHEGLMPNANGVGGPAPTTDTPNNLALIVGNLANWGLQNTGRHKNINYATLKASDFARKARHFARSKCGAPPRMLLWTTDAEKHPMVPRTVESRGRTSAFLEPYCHVEEVVGSNKPRKVRREHSLDLKSMQQVALRMQENTPLRQSKRGTKAKKGNRELSSTYRDWHMELQELEDGFKNLKIPQFIGLPPQPLQPFTRQRKGDPGYTPEFKRMAELRRVLKGQNSEIKKVEDLLQKQAEIDRLDYEAVHDAKTDEDQQLSKYEDIDIRIAELKESQAKLSKKELYRLMFLDDDRRALEMKPQLLMWDRRAAEPLTAQEDDFYHPREMTLLDFQIKPVPDIPATTLDQDVYYDMLAVALLSHKTPINAKFLNSVGPGAFQALIKHAPSLQNPLKGGRRDIASVRARTMTPEMLFELAVAWDEWPFKPALVDSMIQADPAMDNLLRGGGPASRQ